MSSLKSKIDGYENLNYVEFKEGWQWWWNIDGYRLELMTFRLILVVFVFVQPCICILFSIWSTGEGNGDENLQMTFGLHAFTAACAAAVGIKRPKSKECQDAKGKGRDQSNWKKNASRTKNWERLKKTSKPKNWHDRWDRRSNAGDAILTIVDNVLNWRQHFTIYDIDFDNVDTMLTKC